MVPVAAYGASPKAKACKLTIEGEVRRGESFRQAGPRGLDFMLEAIPSGWIVRMLDSHAPRSQFDFAGLASPPYMSPNPILISTDFSFRSQDAIGWNPRAFHYFRTRNDMEKAAAAYRAFMAAPVDKPTPASAAAMRDLLILASGAAPATLEILDAHLVGGTNNQTTSAGLVASRFETTAHVVDQAPAGAHPLGWINRMRFRVVFPEEKVACKDAGKPRH